MRKLIILFVILLTSVVNLFAQERITKYGALTSKVGVTIRFYDVKLSPIRLNEGKLNLENCIRVVKGTPDMFFLRVEKKMPSGAPLVVMIEYNDIVELIKAVNKMSSEVSNDIANNNDYLECCYRTVDGVEIGYYVKNSAATWFLKLDQSSYGTTFMDTCDDFLNALKDVKGLIDGLKVKK